MGGKANEHIRNGRAQEALEELRLGEIDASYTRLVMPLTTTKEFLADATKKRRNATVP
jgi:hypothetical protein